MAAKYPGALDPGKILKSIFTVELLEMNPENFKLTFDVFKACNSIS